MEALQGQLFPAPPMPQVDVRSELLRPVARHAAADGEDAEPLLLQQGLGIVLQVIEGIVAKWRESVAACVLDCAAQNPTQSPNR